MLPAKMEKFQILGSPGNTKLKQGDKMKTFYAEDELKEMSFQSLAERHFMACAKKDWDKARHIMHNDFDKKMHLEYAKVHTEAMAWHEKMRECATACELDG